MATTAAGFGVWGSGVMGDNCVFVRVAVGEGRTARACKRECTHGVMDSRDAYGRVIMCNEWVQGTRVDTEADGLREYT